jgi:hypothetical protein
MQVISVAKRFVLAGLAGRGANHVLWHIAIAWLAPSIAVGLELSDLAGHEWIGLFMYRRTVDRCLVSCPDQSDQSHDVRPHFRILSIRMRNAS